MKSWSYSSVPTLTFGRPTGLAGSSVVVLASAGLVGSAAGFADSADTLRGLAGGALMGSGGVIALGCTIGQAITGVSTLALGSFLAFGAIVAGGIAGVKFMERLLMG